MSVEPKNNLEYVCLLPGGCMLFRKANGVGGYSYYSDSVGGGVLVWDTCLVSRAELLIALAEEEKRHDLEMRERKSSNG